MRKIKLIAAAAAFCIAVSLFAACGKNKDKETEVTSSAADPSGEVTAATQRPVAEGDIFAINKFKVKDVPSNYEFAQKSQVDGDQHFRYIIDEGKANMAVYAANYAEEYGSLADFTGRIRFSMNFNNVLHHCDTEFGEEKSVNIAGFDGVYCDYYITQNHFETDENGEYIKDAEGNDVKTPVAWYTGRIYAFYSDKDAFYFTVESTKDYWDNVVGDFEEKVLPNIYIDENAENDPEENTNSEAQNESAAPAE